MRADAASPTAERITGPSPGADMDGGVLLCQLVEGVSTVRAGGRVPYFVSARRMERYGVRAGPWWLPPKIFEIRRGGKVSSVVRQDDAFGAKSQNLTFSRGGG